MLFFGLFQTVLPQLVLCFCWPKKSAVRGPSVDTSVVFAILGMQYTWAWMQKADRGSVGYGY